MKYIIILISFIVIGCEPYEEKPTITFSEEYVCDETTSKERSYFILECIDNANPKSDEEPEDWIRQCRYMAEQIYCKKYTVKKYFKNNISGFKECYKTEIVKGERK